MTDDLYTEDKIKTSLEVPDVFMPLVMAHPRLLPGETKDSFYLLFDVMVGAIFPNTDLEWLATIDLAWLQFEIQRYRRWKGLIILSNRTTALEEALTKTHPGSALVGTVASIAVESRMQAQQMGSDPDAHPGLRSRLSSNGYDADALNAGAFVQSMLPLVTIEKLLASSRHQLAMILREVGLHREFKRRVRRVMKEVEHKGEETAYVEAAE